MDPITALSLASNIISFIDFGTKLFHGTKNIYDKGFLEENATLEVVARQMNGFITKLLAPNGPNLVGADLELAELAGKCRALGNDLLKLLARIKAKDPTSKRQAIFSAFKNMKYEEEKRGLETRLMSCRTQLGMQLNFLASQENRRKLQNILASSESAENRLGEVYDSVTKLRDGTEIASFSEVAKSQLRQLLQVPEQEISVLAQQRVLKSIAHPGMESMNERYDMVCEAHSKTFEWLVSKTWEDATEPELPQLDSDFYSLGGIGAAFSSYAPSREAKEKEIDERDDILSDIGGWNQFHDTHKQGTAPQKRTVGVPHSSADARARRLARELFLRWLSSGEGVFHVAAKPGAGKSTMMKVMCSNEHVRTLLETWAKTCNRKLVFAKHFFYRLGTNRQKSLAGMHRTLLHEVLESCPELMPLILPTYWAQARSSPWQVGKEIHISDRDVMQAFDRIVEISKTSDEFRFCFFIDGLDELENTVEFSHGELVELLHKWHKRSSGHIKVCVSSREHNVFMNGFSRNQRIRLHELTRRDLESFTQDKLRSIRNPTERSRIVGSILDKAHGVFFWVALVVHNTRRHLEDGFGPKHVAQLIDTLPSEINDLFAYILDSLDTWTKTKAYQTLALMLEAIRWDLEVPVCGYAFLDEYEENFRHDFGITHAIKYDEDRQRKDVQWTTTRLNAICKGLVECRAEKHAEPYLQFGHRSVEEFLMNPKRKREMLSFLDGFNVPEALSHIIILSKRRIGTFDDPSFWSSQGFRELPKLLIMRQEHNLDKDPWLFLDGIESWLGQSEDFALQQRPGMMRIPPNSLIPSLQYKVNREQSSFASPIFILTMLGYEEYPAWKMRHEPIANLNRRKVSLITSCAFESYFKEWHGVERLKPSHSSHGSALIKILLQRGLISCDTEMDWALSFFTPSKGSSLTLLQLCFVTAFLWEQGKNGEWIAGVIGELLRYKPNLNFSLSRNYNTIEIRSNEVMTFQAIFLSNSASKLAITDYTPRQILKKCQFGSMDSRRRILQAVEEQMGQESREYADDKSLASSKVNLSLKQRWRSIPALH